LSPPLLLLHIQLSPRHILILHLLSFGSSCMICSIKRLKDSEGHL
jgi:hypothetical protein